MASVDITPGLGSFEGLPDAQLVERCRSGDGLAWRTLHDRYAPTIYRFISAYGIRDEEREDTCQEVLLAVYRSLPQFRGEARLSTWIYRIAVREASRLIQRRKLRGALSALLLREPPLPAPDPTDRSLGLHLLDEMLKRLSSRKRLVLILFEIAGLPVDEIARIAGCPENTVWSRLHHARAELIDMARKNKGRTRRAK